MPSVLIRRKDGDMKTLTTLGDNGSRDQGAIAANQGRFGATRHLKRQGRISLLKEYDPADILNSHFSPPEQ